MSRGLLTSHYQSDIILISDTERKVFRNERDNTYQEKKRSSVGDNLHSVPCSDRRRRSACGLFRGGRSGSVDRAVCGGNYRSSLSQHGYAEGNAGSAPYGCRMRFRRLRTCVRRNPFRKRRLSGSACRRRSMALHRLDPVLRAEGSPSAGGACADAFRKVRRDSPRRRVLFRQSVLHLRQSRGKNKAQPERRR